ncbi:MAG: nicotinate (nicotinamide) nucleotide adenylyltransferase [Burkholderiaceae bacterium]
MTSPAVPHVLRLGIYGGAFDPPHAAHYALAQAAIAHLQLDQLRIFPTGQAWHRAQQATVAQHRLAMAQLAFADLARAKVDPRETLRPGVTYTIDTVTELHDEYPQAALFLIMGADQFNAFGAWRRWQDIAQIATLCVAARADSASKKALNSTENTALTACKILSIPMPPMPTSATDIRRRVQEGFGLDHLVKPSVARYIAQHHLYSH